MLHFGTQTKKLAALSAAILLTLTLSFCSGGKKDAVAAPEGMHVYDLSRFGKPFSIFVPDTTKTKIEITEQSTGALEIKAGPNFAIAINEQFGDLNQIRSDLKGDEVNKLKQLMVDEPEALVWESEVVQPEFHFFVNKKFNNSEYSFEDIKSTESAPFRRDAVERMYDACKNTQAVQK